MHTHESVDETPEPWNSPKLCNALDTTLLITNKAAPSPPYRRTHLDSPVCATQPRAQHSFPPNAPLSLFLGHLRVAGFPLFIFLSVGGSHRAEYGALDRGLLDPVKTHACPKVDAFSHTSKVHSSINLLPNGHFHVTPPEKARFWTRRRPSYGLYAPNGPPLLRDIERQSGATCCAIFRLRGGGARKCANYGKFRVQFHGYCLIWVDSWVGVTSG